MLNSEMVMGTKTPGSHSAHICSSLKDPATTERVRINGGSRSNSQDLGEDRFDIKAVH